MRPFSATEASLGILVGLKQQGVTSIVFLNRDRMLFALSASLNLIVATAYGIQEQTALTNYLHDPAAGSVAIYGYWQLYWVEASGSARFIITLDDLWEKTIVEAFDWPQSVYDGSTEAFLSYAQNYS